MLTMFRFVTSLTGTVVRVWLGLITFFICFIFIPLVLAWLVLIVIMAERAGSTPFWR